MTTDSEASGGTPDQSDGADQSSSRPEGQKDGQVEATDSPEGEMAAATLPRREDARALSVIGLGGSAGSIPALEAFFGAARPGSGSAFVVVLHLSPEHESHLAEVLARSSVLPVQQVTGPVTIAADHVYVIPPGKHLEIQDSQLHLRDLEPGPGGTRVAIDTFFRTLADAYGPQAGAVILSGTGQDGTIGLKLLKEQGGLVVAQSPMEAEYDAMPRSAIATGLVDYVLPAAAMPAQIAQYWETSRRMRLPEVAAPSPEQVAEGAEQEAALQAILAQVRAQTRHDFTVYKRGTVLRRIGRRMQVNRLESLPAYRDFLGSHPAEVDDLVGDLLISVTQFFRDPGAWAALERDVIPRLFHNKGAQDEVRAWVCGCATGEEAYTLALLLLERAGTMDRPPRIQVFATDMDAEAIARARVGVYPETIAADVPEERLRRWFHRQGGNGSGTYQVRHEVREAVLFAGHDALRDTPFSRLDLVTCRNLLIYVNGEGQERLFQTFHFALRPDGWLFLGSSESAAGAADLFGVADKQHHLYIRRPLTRAGAPLLPAPTGVPAAPSGAPARRVLARDLPATLPTAPRTAPAAGGGELLRSLLERYGPATALIDAAYDIVHLSGGAERFLRVPGGEPTHNLLPLIRPDLRLDLRTALFAAAAEGTEQVRLVRRESSAPVRLVVRPVDVPEGARGYLLVLFEELPELAAEVAPAHAAGDASGDAASAAIASAEVVRQLEAENATLQRQLRSTVEQYEASVEELRASNEELQALNEELRSAAEELETSKEELQSVNEELSTVNAELKHRVEEVSRTNSDLHNLLTATDIGTIFLDRELRIQRYTPAAETLFNLIPGDLGRPLAHVTHRVDYPGLIEDAGRVLARLAPVEREVGSRDDRHFLARLLPYRSLDDRIEGVVVTFVDITGRKRAEEALRQSEEQFRRAIEDAPIPVIMHAEEGEVLQISRTWTELTGYTLQDVPTFEAWLTRAYGQGADAVRAHMHALFRGDQRTLNVEFPVRTRAGDLRHWSFSASSPGTLHDGRRFIVGMAVDITERMRAEEALRRSEEQQAFLLRLGDAIRPLADPVEVQAVASRLLGEQLGVERAYYVEINEAGREFIVARDWHQPGAPSHARRYPLEDWPMPWLSDGQSWVMEDVDFDPLLSGEQRASYRGNNIRAAVVAPLLKDGCLVATFVVNQNAPRAWTASEVALVEETAERTWAAVERARAEEALRESEEKFRTLFDSIDEGYLIGEVLFEENDKPVDILYLDANPAAVRLAGRDFTGRRMREIDPDYEEDWYEIFGHVALTGQAVRAEHYAEPHGQWFDFYAFRIGGQESHRVASVFQDTTERRRAEEALRQGEARFRTLSDAVPQVIWTNSATGEADYFNRRWYDYSGLSYEESAGPGWQVIVHPEDAPASVERWQRALAAGEVFDCEYRLRGKDGAYRWFLGRNVPLKDDAGRVTGWFGSATDIEERKQAEQALRESEERFRLLVEGARDYAMFLLDAQNRIAFWSTGAARVFGWSQAEAIGQKGDLIFTPEDRRAGAPAQEVDTARAAGRAEDRRWHVRKDGSRLFADGVLMRLDSPDGGVRGFAKIARDTTAQREIEEALHQAHDELRRAHEELERRVQKRTASLSEALTALEGALAARQQAEVARDALRRQLVSAEEEQRQRLSRDLHDQTGQDLAALTLKLSALDHAVGVAGAEQVAELKRLADRIARDMHHIAVELRPVVLDDMGLPTALQNYVEEWMGRFGRKVDFDDTGFENKPRLPLDIETTIYRVVQEALTNVLRHAQASRVEVLLNRRADEVQTIVEDNGIGFDAEAEGTNGRLGLLGMRERAELVGGTLEIESSPGSGTTVFLRIPLS